MNNLDERGAADFSVDDYVQLNFTALDFDELQQWLGDNSFAHASALVKLAFCKMIRKQCMHGAPLPMRLNLMTLDMSTRLPKIAEETVVEGGDRELRRSQLERVGRFRVTNLPRAVLYTAGADPNRQLYAAHHCWPVRSHFEHSWSIYTKFADGHELNTTSGKPPGRVGMPKWRSWAFEDENKLPVVLNTHRRHAAKLAALHGGVADHEPTLRAFEISLNESWQRYVTFGLDRKLFKPTRV